MTPDTLPDVWQDDDIFTEAHARFVMERGACRVALTYCGQTIGKVAAARPWAALKYAADRLTPERLDDCAAARPWAALKYAADRLTPELRKLCQEALA